MLNLEVKIKRFLPYQTRKYRMGFIYGEGKVGKLPLDFYFKIMYFLLCKVCLYMRDILEMPNKLTQGTIFSNAKSSQFSHDVYGLIISGRCDIENSHYQTFLYLPIIKLKRWFDSFILKKIIKKNANDAEREIQLKFSNKKLSIEVLKYVNRRELISKHFKAKEQDKINKYFEKIDFFNEISAGKIHEQNLKCKLTTKEKDDCMKEVDRLLKNDFNGFFYLENVDYYEQRNGKCHHFVIVLNEVQTLPVEVANYLCDGIDLSQHENFKQYFGNDSCSLAISTITSPHIEYIIQYYTSLFRIGIDRASIDNYDFLFEE